jgi:hypothetical protein
MDVDDHRSLALAPVAFAADLLLPESTQPPALLALVLALEASVHDEPVSVALAPVAFAVDPLLLESTQSPALLVLVLALEASVHDEPVSPHPDEAPQLELERLEDGGGPHPADDEVLPRPPAPPAPPPPEDLL